MIADTLPTETTTIKFYDVALVLDSLSIRTVHYAVMSDNFCY